MPKKKKSPAELLAKQAAKTFHLHPEEGIDCAFLAVVEAEIAMQGELTLTKAMTFLRLVNMWALFQIALDFHTTPKLTKGTRAQQLKRWKKLSWELTDLAGVGFPIPADIPLPLPHPNKVKS